jgi:CheY-like chemotaxis protein
MPEGGEITVETDNCQLSEDQTRAHDLLAGAYIKITVSDTGTGMDGETLKRIFDPFFTTKAMGRGTGLGLAMVYSIIKGHHGMIDVTSAPGQGSSFCLYLPASEKKIVHEAAAPETLLTGTETILLVDDEETVLEVSAELLSALGYRIYAVASGQEAVAVYMEKGKDIDMVILDMVMPGISGAETFERLRQLNPDLRVLLASGYSIDGQAQQIMDRGCRGFLQKPFELSVLSQKVRDVLNS